MSINESDSTKAVQSSCIFPKRRLGDVTVRLDCGAVLAFLPAMSALAALALHLALPMNAQFMERPLPYYKK